MRTKHTLGGQPGVLAAHLSSVLEGRTLVSHLVKIIYVYTVRLQLRSSYSLNKKKRFSNMFCMAGRDSDRSLLL